MMDLTGRPTDRGSERDSFDRLFADARPDVRPLAEVQVDRILAASLSAAAGRSRPVNRWRIAWTLSPIAAAAVLSVLTPLIRESRVPTILPGRSETTQTRASAPTRNIGIPHVDLSRSMVAVRDEQPRKNRLSVHARHSRRLAGHRARIRAHESTAQYAGNVEFVAGSEVWGTPIGYWTDSIPAPDQEVIEASNLVEIDVRVSGNAEPGYARTTAFDTDVSGGVVENACTVSGPANRDSVVTTTSASSPDNRVLVSVIQPCNMHVGTEEIER